MKGKGLLGKKLGMTQVYDDNGAMLPVTVVQLGPCTVTQVKTVANDGYSAIQLGFEERKVKSVTRPFAGHFKKHGLNPMRFVRELRIPTEDEGAYEPKKQLKVTDLFHENDMVDVIGTSIGKGYAGVMKRHNFNGAPASHGAHEFHRHGGTIGCRTTPGRTWKGRRMAGQLGNERVTTLNLRVVKILEKDNLILIRGSIPGPTNGYVVVRAAVKG
ncbi:MAG: 50S ribosomal protein L3 [Deltaproteobacteria bacterium RIFOXYA12_FULL_61_11]|nr:MAG: 50S ribosomal protein L3 [Deltaproteobacteria bacterium RIFOXYA12_FULL_61_11]